MDLGCFASPQLIISLPEFTAHMLYTPVVSITLSFWTLRARETPGSTREVIDHLQSALIHPAGNGDKHEPKRIQNHQHFIRDYRQYGRWKRRFKQIRFSGPYAAPG